MSRIIKSMAVVDARAEQAHFLFQAAEPDTPGHVIKRQSLSGGQTVPMYRPPMTRDSQLEELNRVRVEIAEAQKELRTLHRQQEEAEERLEALRKEQEALAKLDGLTVDDQAKAILRDAESQAAQTVEWAKQQAAEAVEQLKAQGYLDGLEQGANEAREQYRLEHTPAIERLQQLLTRLSGLETEMVARGEKDIVALIVALAERVVGRQLNEDPKALVDMLRDVMEQNRREAFIKITISPDLMPAQAKVSESIRKAIQAMGQQVDIVVDNEAQPGTVLAETPKGFTDLSVSTQLQNLHEALLEE